MSTAYQPRVFNPTADVLPSHMPTVPDAPYPGPRSIQEAVSQALRSPEIQDFYGDHPAAEEIATEEATRLWPYLFVPEAVRAERNANIRATNEAARVLEGYTRRTPLQVLAGLSAQTGNRIWVKREDMQETRSFKERGSYYLMSQLTAEERSRGVIAASAGNHASGVARAGKALGVPVTVCMPTTTPLPKREVSASYGATLEFEGNNFSETAAYTAKRAEDTGMVPIPPFEHELIRVGQSTLIKESLEQLRDAEVEKADIVFVPAGGGGQLAGVSRYVKSVSPHTKVIGVQVEGSTAIAESFQNGYVTTVDKVNTLADGVAVREPGAHCVELIKRYVDDVIVVSPEELVLAMDALKRETGVMPEGAGALSVAGATRYLQENNLTDQEVITVMSGANIAEERRAYVLEKASLLRGEQTIAVVELPEEPGALAGLCKDVIQTHDIRQFYYRRGREPAHILLNCSTEGLEDRASLLQNLDQMGYNPTDYSDNEQVVKHLRHMVGGSYNGDKNEQIFTLTFPERPGALNDFLSILQSRWNISLFSYQNQGSEFAEVAIGFEAATAEELETVFADAGYDYARMDDQLAKIFL
jgi:threonine dehydratase